MSDEYSRKKLVLITRPLGRVETTVKSIQSLGLESLIEPMLSIEDVNFNLPNLYDFQGLIFTSVHGVERFHGHVLDKHMPVYVVGKRTGEVARRCGFMNVITGGGDVDALGRMLVKQAINQKPFLHVCGADVAGDLVGDLEAYGFGLTRLEVYRAVMAERFSDVCIEALSGQSGSRVSIVMFYSKRTAAAFMRLVDAHAMNVNLEAGLRDIKVLCISQSVLECVQPELWLGVYVAPHPDEAGMLALLKQHTH